MGSIQKQRRLGGLLVNGGLLLLILVWTIPTFGLFVSSFRTREDIQTSGWWNIFPHREWQVVRVILSLIHISEPTRPY